MKRVCFAYVVQCDMPGNPIKVGCSKNPRNRYRAFLGHTPADMRLLGVTIDGKHREELLKAALAPTLIRGEWGRPNAGVDALVRGWVEAGEWFVPAPDHVAHITATRVNGRLEAAGFGAYRATPDSIGYPWASDVLNACATIDPLLGLDWDGFAPSRDMPDMRLSAPSPSVASQHAGAI